jgi:hypothetical protein
MAPPESSPWLPYPPSLWLNRRSAQPVRSRAAPTRPAASTEWNHTPGRPPRPPPMLPRGDRGLELYRQPESDSPNVVVHLHLEALVVLPPRAWSADLPSTPQELSRSNLQLQRLRTDPLLVLPAFQPVGVPAGLQFQCHPHGCRIPGRSSSCCGCSVACNGLRGCALPSAHTARNNIAACFIARSERSSAPLLRHNRPAGQSSAE